MQRSNGIVAVNDDEWYTPYDTAFKVAMWLRDCLDVNQPILCPADILPNGTESEIPRALRDVGFERVRVTRNLPLIHQVGRPELDWSRDEVIVTNPPFSLLIPFQKFVHRAEARFCVLSRPATMRNCWPIPTLKDRFFATNGKAIAAAWMQNLVNTENRELGKPIGNCMNCERLGACPQNSMTGHLKPRQDRPLYGWGTAVKNGSAGFFCIRYTVNGKKAFARFFHEVRKVEYDEKGQKSLKL